MIDIAKAAKMAEARGVAPKSSPSSERSAPTRLMMTPRKQQWSTSPRRSSATPRSGPESPKIAARHSDPPGDEKSSQLSVMHVGYADDKVIRVKCGALDCNDMKLHVIYCVPDFKNLIGIVFRFSLLESPGTW